MADFRLSGKVTVDAADAVQALDRLEGEVAQANVAMREQQSAAAAAARALEKLKTDTLANADAVAKARQELVAAEQAQLKLTSAAKAAQQALIDHQRATGGLAVSSGAARAAMTNLGQQIGDVTQGLVMGTNPATIFAQQAGQIAFAVQGMGGAMAGVARFLGGPWGIALTTAAVALSPFIGKLFETSEKARVAKDGTISFSREVGIALSGLGSLAASAFQPPVTGFQSAIDGIRSKLPAFKDVIGGALRGIDSFNNLGVGLFGRPKSDLAGQYERYRGKEVARAAKQDELDALYAPIDEANAGQAGREAIQQFTEQRKAKLKELQAEYLRLAQSFNPLIAAQLEYKKTLEDIAKAEKAGLLSAQAAAVVRRDSLPEALQRQVGGSAAPVRITSAGLATAFDQAGLQQLLNDNAQDVKAIGEAIADGATERFLRETDEISRVLGAGIGQSFGKVVQSGGAIAGLLSKLSPGAGDGFTSAFSDTIKEAFKPVVSGLKDLFKGVFGDGGSLGKLLGGVAGLAGIGGVVSDVASFVGIKNFNTKQAVVGGVGGGLLGGALGGALVIPGLGPILAVIGAIFGGLIQPKNPFVDVALKSSASGASGNVYNSRGGDESLKIGNQFAQGVNDALAGVAQALGAEIKSGLNLGSIGFSGKEFYFNPTGGDFKGAGVQKFAEASDAITAAVANALSQNAISASPKVQAALQRYAGNVNQAISEALKVKSIEDLLDSSTNPFSGVIKAFEQQARQRLAIAKDYGFDVVEIEKINAAERKKVIDQALEQSVGSAKALLDDLKFGSRATGSFGERRAALITERDRLIGLANAGDNSAAQKLTEVLQQLLDVSSAGYGATGAFAADRASTVSVLQALVDQRQAQIEAAASAARTPDPQLTEANASLDDLVTISQRMAASLADIAARGGVVASGGGIAGLYARAAE